MKKSVTCLLGTRNIRVVLLIMLLCMMMPVVYASDGGDSIGSKLTIWSVVPFAGMLFSIAVCPLVNGHWWEKNLGVVSLFWSLAFVIPFAVQFSINTAIIETLHIIVLDYVPFIILLASLFMIAGGIIVRGTMKGTPLFNATLLAIGSLLASVIGTTGSAMLLIRPLINANKNRQYKVHTIVWAIFLIGNIGGVLTPVGDPPLFIGFLHGVPFFWTLKLIVPFILNVGVLIALYFMIDSYFCNKEGFSKGKKQTVLDPLRIDGLFNFIFIAGVLCAIIMSGMLANHAMFYDAAKNTPKALTILSLGGHDIAVPYVNIMRDSIILLMGLLSMHFTAREIRSDNNFTWGPIREVGLLFAGIFVTIVPAIAMLQAKGAELGVNTPVQFFWAAGTLSSFLDNTPTYLIFLSLAGKLGAQTGVVTDLGTVAPQILAAISCGAVFMGANTYIGNAPNFMIKSIAEENGIKMPNFFSYMLISVCVLIPLFILNTWLFFL